MSPPSSPSPTNSSCQASGYDDIFLQDGSSPLMAASCNGHLDTVKTLIEKGADVNQTDKVYVYTL